MNKPWKIFSKSRTKKKALELTTWGLSIPYIVWSFAYVNDLRVHLQSINFATKRERIHIRVGCRWFKLALVLLNIRLILVRFSSGSTHSKRTNWILRTNQVDVRYQEICPSSRNTTDYHIRIDISYFLCVHGINSTRPSYYSPA